MIQPILTIPLNVVIVTIIIPTINQKKKEGELEDNVDIGTKVDAIEETDADLLILNCASIKTNVFIMNLAAIFTKVKKNLF